jgi:glycosyltransferase involved in cell wall biosynthesis
MPVGNSQLVPTTPSFAMRVLILADDCNPDWPSLPIVGYKAARAIAEHADVVIATHVRNRQNIEKVGFGRAQVRYIDSEYVARPLCKFARSLRRGTETAWTTATALYYPSYLAFEWEVWKATRNELRTRAFDVVHRITPMSPTLPSPMASWSPVPFVIGPINGGLRWPPAFRDELAREREWLSYVRNVYRVLPYQGSTYRRSAAVLAAFRHTIEDLPKHARSNVIEFPEVGIDPQVFNQIIDRPARKQKTILFAGRFVPYKLPQLVVRAFADHLALHQHRLVMIGDGPERPAIEQLIRNRGLQNRVELLGWKSQADVAQLMREADIFAFASIRELGAGVVVEAMASGLACVVVDYGGPATLIDVNRGVKVPLGDRDQLTRSFGQALEYLIADEHTSSRLGLAARQHVMRHYTWDAKARKMLAVYKWVLGRGARPDFWAPE